MTSSLFLAAVLVAGPMTQAERDRVTAHFEMTAAWLESEVAGLSAKQLRFRAREGAWSVLDTVEHLATAEPQYWQNLQDALAKPAEPAKKSKSPDAGVLWYGIDRTRRATTGEARTPKARYTELAPPLAEFRQTRQRFLEFIRTNQQDLRAHFLSESMDAYQWLVMISAHAQRHVLQIREIKADPQFPR